MGSVLERTIVYHSKGKEKQRLVRHPNGVSHMTEIPDTHAFYFPEYNFTAGVIMDSSRKCSKNRPAGMWLTWEGRYPYNEMEKIELKPYVAKELNDLYLAYAGELKKFEVETREKVPITKSGLSFRVVKADPVGAKERLAAALDEAFEKIIFEQPGKSI
jgi:hypothetical protein